MILTRNLNIELYLKCLSFILCHFHAQYTPRAITISLGCLENEYIMIMRSQTHTYGKISLFEVVERALNLGF